MSAAELRRYLAIAFGLLFICGFVFYSSFIIGILIGSLSLLGIPIYSKSLAENRKTQLTVQFKDMLYSISSSITSGRHLSEAIRDSEKAIVLIYGENSILANEIKNMCRIMEETNCSEETVLADLAKRSHVNEISDFADICVTCRTTGGDMNRMIYKAVFMITQNIELQKEKDVLLSQKKLESRILAAMPIMVTGFINMSSPDYMETMYTTFSGRVIMSAAFAGTIISFLWSMKMINSRV